MNSCEAKEYALNHTLVRPKINWCLIIASVLIAETILFIALLLLHKNLIVYFPLINAIVLFFSLKGVLRLLIKCHQRYAPDYVRRRCKCKPSCSEYALIALDKYILPVALIKIHNRLFHTCKGDYKVDYP